MFKRKDLIGQKIAQLEVLEEINQPFINKKERRATRLILKCRCNCGKIFYPFKSNVLGGKTHKCINCCRNSHLLGKKIDKLKVLSRDYSVAKPSFNCICDCGWNGSVLSRYLRLGKPPIQCPHCRYPKKYTVKVHRSRKQAAIERGHAIHLKAREKLIGSRIGRLKILSFSRWIGTSGRRKPLYNAKCDCGNTIEYLSCSGVKSCGCLQKDSVLKAENSRVSKLTNKQVKAIRELKAAGVGYTARQFAKMFHVSESMIGMILKHKTYKI